MQTILRDAYFDNLKFVLILFVVIGHSIEALCRMGEPFNDVRVLYVFLYSFHMPLFIIIAGYFTKTIDDKGWWRKRAFNFLSLYLVFSVIHFFIGSTFFPSPATASISSFFIVPFNGLWFLLSMAVWYAIAPYVIKVRHYLIISIIAGLATGYLDFINWELSLSRSIVFLPFFLMGYKIKTLHIKEHLVSWRTGILCIVLACSLLPISSAYLSVNPREILWVFGASAYHKLGHMEWYAFIFRLAEYGVWIFMSFMIASVVPRNKTFFTKWGQNTIYVFLLHEFIYRYIGNFGFYQLMDSTFAKLLLIGMAIIVCVLLSTNFVRRIVSVVIDFDYYGYLRHIMIGSKDSRSKEL